MTWNLVEQKFSIASRLAGLEPVSLICHCFEKGSYESRGFVRDNIVIRAIVSTSVVGWGGVGGMVGVGRVE